MHTVVVGLNNKTAHVSLREKLYFSDDILESAYSRLFLIEGIKGAVILSTCNRVEVYCSVTDTSSSTKMIVKFLSEFHNIDEQEFKDHIYVKNCSQAVSHLFRVVSSLDSMVVGEYQIQGQIRDAYQYSFDNNRSDALLNKVFQNAIQIGKRVRSETNIGKGSVSIGSVATDQILEEINTDSPLKVLFVGSGKMSQLTAKSLVSRCKIDMKVTNRTLKNAYLMAEEFNCGIIPFDQKEKSYSEFDVIVVSTSSKEHLLTRDILCENGVCCKNDKTLIIDLSVPRNVNPDVEKIAKVEVRHVDDFEKVLEANINKRKDSIEEVEAIIKEVSNDYYDWYAMQTIIPVMKVIKTELTDISLRTINAHKTFMNTLDDSQKDTIKLMLKESSDKLIRIIMKNLKNVTGKDDLYTISETLQKTFNSNIDE